MIQWGEQKPIKHHSPTTPKARAQRGQQHMSHKRNKRKCGDTKKCDSVATNGAEPAMPAWHACEDLPFENVTEIRKQKKVASYSGKGRHARTLAFSEYSQALQLQHASSRSLCVVSPQADGPCLCYKGHKSDPANLIHAPLTLPARPRFPQLLLYPPS